MKLQNKSYIILLIFFFSSCVAKKSIIEYKDRIVKDTIIQTKTIKEIERFTDTLTIEKPCDSLGNLKPFKQFIKTKQGSISIQGINNVISAKIDLKGYKDMLEREYKTKYEKLQEIKEKTIIKYKYPLWLMMLPIITLVVGYLIGRFRLI